jgi:hypothetical protein
MSVEHGSGDSGRTELGLAALAGALAAEWSTVEDDMEEIITARQHLTDPPPPDLS